MTEDEQMDRNMDEEIEALHAELSEVIQSNADYIADNKLGMAPGALAQTQLRVLVQTMFPDVTDQIRFDIKVHEVMRGDMEAAVENHKAESARATLTQGISTNAIRDIEKGKLPAGVTDLETLRDGPRPVRRALERAEKKGLFNG